MNPEDWLRHYLCLEADGQKELEGMSALPILAQPLRALKGLRLLRQEPWECTVSYMFAQGLSVKVIRHALRKFCRELGKPLEGVENRHSFPEPADLALYSPGDLMPFTNNYRARASRIIRLSRAVLKGSVDLEKLRDLPCDEAKKILMGLDGIGPKIADCILLFSMEQSSAFPVDRWVFRAMKSIFPSFRRSSWGAENLTAIQYAKMVDKARIYFGEHCGLAGEYLFLFFRMRKDKKLREELIPYCTSLEESI